MRNENFELDWFRKESWATLLEGLYKLIAKALNSGCHLSIITDSKALRLSLQSQYLSPWEERMTAKKIAVMLAGSMFKECTVVDFQAQFWFTYAAHV